LSAGNQLATQPSWHAGQRSCVQDAAISQSIRQHQYCPHATKVLSVQLASQSCHQAARATALQIHSVAPNSLEPGQNRKYLQNKIGRDLTRPDSTVIGPHQLIKLQQTVDSSGQRASIGVKLPPGKGPSRQRQVLQALGQHQRSSDYIRCSRELAVRTLLHFRANRSFILRYSASTLEVFCHSLLRRQHHQRHRRALKHQLEVGQQINSSLAT
jgi:hypothetical protein